MKKYILVILALSAQPATAQYQFRFQVDASALRTHLYNAKDDASGMVTSSPQITPNGGFTFSWVDTGRRGFQGIHTGLEYLRYGQSTAGKDLSSGSSVNGFTTSRIQYLTVPVEARWGLSKRKGIMPFATLGIYAAVLLNYRETERQIVFTGATPAEDFALTREVHGRHFYESDPFGGNLKSKLTLEKGIYRSFNFGLVGSIGFEKAFGDRGFFSLRIPIRYGLTDVERKGEIKFKETRLNTLPSSIRYWNNNTPKGLPYIYSRQNPEERSTTHPISYGLEVSYGLYLSPRKTLLK